MRPIRIPWAAFCAAAFPIIAAYYRPRRRSPTSTYLRRQGHGWIVSAAYKHYGDYRSVLRRLGFPRATRPAIHQSGCRPQGYWLADDNIRRELNATFPELLSWETMPSIHMIQARLPGLGSRILRIEKLSTLTERLGLQSYWIGQRHRRRVEGIEAVLSFYEQHIRWPRASECSSGVRTTRFIRGTSWHDYCRPVGLPKCGLARLVERFRQHRAWLQQHQPKKVLVRQRVLNYLIIELARRFPPLP